MKHSRVALAGIVSLFLLAGCSPGPTVLLQGQTAQENFLIQLREEAPDSRYSPDDQLLEIGERVCSDLEAGADLKELGARDLAESLTDETVELIRTTQALAAILLCPEAI